MTVHEAIVALQRLLTEIEALEIADDDAPEFVELVSTEYTAVQMGISALERWEKYQLMQELHNQNIEAPGS